MTKLNNCFFVMTIFLFSGCCTIFSKTSYPVYIHTNPAGVNITITNSRGIDIYKGVSPATVSLHTSAGFFNKASYQVKFKQPGFGERIVPVNFKLNGWYFGNLLIGGILGMLVIDPATGAMWKIRSEDKVIEQSFDNTTGALNTSPSLQIIDISTVSKDMQSALVRLN